MFTGLIADLGEIEAIERGPEGARLRIGTALASRLGGAGARPLAGGRGAPDLEQAERALAMSWEASGDDLLVRARLREW